MVAALGWGALAASSLVLGVILAFLRPWPTKLVGLVLSFGAGALISAVSFSLTDEGFDVGDEWVVGVGLALGALVYYAASRVLASRSGGTGGGGTGSELVLGSFLDGIPEQFVLGVGLAVIDSMIPEAREKGGQAAGLLAVLGFAVATALANA